MEWGLERGKPSSTNNGTISLIYRIYPFIHPPNKYWHSRLQEVYVVLKVEELASGIEAKVVEPLVCVSSQNNDLKLTFKVKV